VESRRVADPRVIELLCHLVAQADEHAFILTEVDGRVIWVSPGAEKLFSLRRGAFVGRRLQEIFTERDRDAGIDILEFQIATNDAIAEDDRWHLRADGTRFWSAGALVPLRTATGELLGFGKIIRDRTDLKTQLELQLNQIEQLTRHERAAGLAITKFTHELRNAVTGMRGTIEILNAPLDNEAVRKKFAGLMQRQLEMIERLADDLLDVKRAESGKISLRLEALSLPVELRAVLESCERKLRERRISARLLAPTADVVVNADRQRLQQVFGNLVDNAIKYTPPDGRIWVKLTTEDEVAVVHVEDTGVGIPHDMLQRIFELFTQVDPHRSSGLGVGLALVRELVMLHGGSVQAISKGINQGSEFSVRLPLLAVEPKR
jgi:two-component system CheB/CheR fusion protein